MEFLHRKPEFYTGNQDFAPEIAPKIENLHQDHPFLVQILKGLYQIRHKIVTKLQQIAPEIPRSLRLSLQPAQNPSPLVAASPEGIGLLFSRTPETTYRVRRAASGKEQRTGLIAQAVRHAERN